VKHALAATLASVGVVLVTLAQSADFTRQMPAWQVALAASNETAAGAAIAAQGKGAALACAGCHGANGIAAEGAPFPRLAGLPVEYVAKQLFDYREGSRPNAIMTPIAKALGDADIASLSWHYAALDAPGGNAVTADRTTRGRQLARYGDNALALPACIDCHGSDQSGGGPILPPLAQPAAYTSAQLQAFRTGERRNDADNVMREFSKRLSDADIEALAGYYAGR
jgi:cytochrome c553